MAFEGDGGSVRPAPEVQRQIRDYLQDPSKHPTGRGLKKNSSRNDVLATLSAVLRHGLTRT